jgi:hypothetical protein
MNNQQISRFSFCIDLVFVAALGLMLFCSIATIFWGADKSLGMADEGLYLLAARYPDEIKQNISSVYVYTGYLFRMVDFHPTSFRLLGVLLDCISAAVFWFGFYKLLIEFYPKVKALRYFRSYSLFFIELGALLHYQWFYMVPNYNTLIGIAINVYAGGMLWGFAQVGNWQKNKKTATLAFALAGLSIGLAFFTKFPAGICLLALCILMIALWIGVELHKKTKLLVAIFIGTFVWFSGHFLFVQPLQTWWQMFKAGWDLYQTLGVHTLHSKQITYVYDLIFFVYSAIKIYWPSYLIMCLVYPFYMWRWNGRELSERAKMITILIVLLSAIFLSVKAGLLMSERKSIDGSIPFYAVFHLAWILLLFTLWLFNSWFKSRQRIACDPKNINVNIVLGLLVALPIAGSVGTSNPLYNLPLCFAATWFGAILLLLVMFPFGEHGNLRLKILSVISIGAFTTSQIIQGYIFDPQGISRNILQQVEETSVGFPARTLKLDLPTHELVNQLTSIAKANGFQPGGDIIAISYIPGLVYAMGGRSPGHPTFMVGSLGLIDKEHVESYSKLALQYADINRLENAFVLLDVEPENAESLLASRGLVFPKAYKKIGAVVVSGVAFSLWKPSDITKR